LNCDVDGTILVAGGAGFMGSAFAAAAHRAGLRIAVFDALTYAGDERRLSDCGIPYELVGGDVADAAALTAAVRAVAPSAVVNFAAQSHATRAAADEQAARRVNVDGARVLFEVAGAERVPHVVHISTAEVYGERVSGHADESDAPALSGLGAYAASKRDAEAVAARFSPSVLTSIVRPTIAFGPYQHPEKALPRWICSALRGEPLQVWGDGSPVRQWVAVEDIADAIVRIVRARTAGVFNVGAHHVPEITNLDMAKRVLYESGADTDLLRLVPNESRPGERRFSVAIDRIARLGWRPGDFTAQLRATVRWYADNRTWWEPLRDEAERLYRRPEPDPPRT
jgi:dTDP-glucose 4,6-dehydratase